MKDVLRDNDAAERCARPRYAAAVDDLYNLAVRKKAAALCVDALSALVRLPDACAAHRVRISGYGIQNGQVQRVLEGIYAMLCGKAEPPLLPPEGRPPHPAVLLTGIIDNLLDLAGIITVRRAEREIVMCAQICFKQLAEMYGA